MMQNADPETPTDPPDSVRTTLAEPNDIYGWSYGEIKTAELFDPEHQTFHPAGLYSDSIFGRLRKYAEVLKTYRDADPMARFVKSKWNMDVANPERRTRFGHICLPVPVIHPWFWGHDDAPLEVLLGMSHRRIGGIVRGRIGVDLFFPGPHLSYRSQVLDAAEQFGAAWHESPQTRTGAAAIKEMLAALNYRSLEDILRERCSTHASQLSSRRLRRLEFRMKLVSAVGEHRLVPQAMVLDTLPVLPAGCRGLQLGRDGKIRTDWLTAAYRRIIRTADRYRSVVDKYVGLCPPTPMELDRERQLRIALTCEIEWLFAELLRRGSPLRRDRFVSRPPKLSWHNTQPAEWWPIVPDPNLRLFQCRIPIAAWKHQVGEPDLALDKRSQELPSSLPPTLLQFAPMQAPSDLSVLQPVLGPDQAIHVHPQLLCAIDRAEESPSGRFFALQSDAEQNDGDRLAFPVRRPQSLPVSFENLPTELLVGCTWATMPPVDFEKARDEWARPGWSSRWWYPQFASLSAVVDAWEAGRLSLSQVIFVKLPQAKFPIDGERDFHQQTPKIYCTTAARVVVNSLLPESIPFCDHTLTRSVIRRLIRRVEAQEGAVCATGLLESLMEFARQVLTRSGMSLALDDLRAPDRLAEVLKELDAGSARAQKLLTRGLITSAEHLQRIWDARTQARSRADSELVTHFSDAGTGSRLLRALIAGTRTLTPQSVRLLCGFPGFLQLSSSHQVQTVQSNYHRGLTMLDYWSVAAVERHRQWEQHRPSAAQALRRRLANLLSDLVVTEDDCGTPCGITIECHGTDETQAKQEFIRSIAGRISLDAPRDLSSSEPMAAQHATITRAQVERIGNSGVRRIRVRHTLSCEARRGVCRRCFGGDADSGELVALGTPVGIRAALEVGSLLEKLPMTAPTTAEQFRVPASDAKARMPGVVSLKQIKLMIGRDGERFALSNRGRIELLNDRGETIDRYEVPHGARIPVAAGDRVTANTVLAEWSLSHAPVFSRREGTVRITGPRARAWTLISIEDSSRTAIDGCLIPSVSDFAVKDGDTIEAGALLAEVTRIQQAQVRPRSRNLREFWRMLSLRAPRHPAVLAETDGTIDLDYDGTSSCCVVRILNGTSIPVQQTIRLTRHRTLIVRTGEKVEPGDPLTTGEVDLVQLVRLKNAAACYTQLEAQLRECLPFSNRPEGFDVRHFELLLTRLFRWAEVSSDGDSGLVSGQILPKGRILARNKRLRSMRVAEPLPEDDRDITQDALTREEFESLRAQLLTDDPKLPPIEPVPAWPAGWVRLLRGWETAAASSGSPLSSGGFFPTREALVQAALFGWSEELSGVKDAVLLGRPIEIGDAIRNFDAPEDSSP